MSRLSRREFLRLLAAATGSLAIQQFLSGCDRQAVPTQSLPSPTQPLATGTSPAGGTASAEPTPEEPTAASTQLPASAPDLVVARGSDPEVLVQRALAAFGGMEKFVPKNSSVIVKPNICVAYHTYEYAATTNPWVVAALVKACFEAGAASVKVMDMPFGGTQEEAYVKSGIAEQVQAAGGEMVFMPALQYVNVDIPQGESLTKVKVFGEVLNADVLINVPIAKTHSLAYLTLGMKNLMGVIQNRSYLHASLGQRIADLTSLLRPALTVVDAVRILTANGPTGGNLEDVKQLDTLIVSPDIVAADSYATTLFGKDPEDIPYIPPAVKLGLGRSDIGNLRIEEIAA